MILFPCQYFNFYEDVVLLLLFLKGHPRRPTTWLSQRYSAMSDVKDCLLKNKSCRLKIEMKNAPSFLGYSQLSAEITAGAVDHREQIDRKHPFSYYR